MIDKKCVIEYYKGIPQEVRELADRLYTIDKSDNSMYVFTFNGDWFYVPMVDGKRVQKSIGTWECKGNNHFIITTETHTLDSSDDKGWVEKPPVEQEPEEEPEQSTEPNFDRTNFPLKKGSEGKEVIQLQNYLNKEIPANPLVIDGIFGDLTHNKLVQVQKNKGVL
jgi:hypothetical protein